MCMLRAGLVKNCRRCKSSVRLNCTYRKKAGKKNYGYQQKERIESLSIFNGEAILSKPAQRHFDRIERKSCIYKESSYCWNHCPFNLWKVQ